jgi:catechol 2,3-dioxygenase-like lactoylglutathione lyase family enzyme
MSMRIHLSLAVSDLEASLRFYQQLFGQLPSKIRAGYANFRLDQPPIHLALVQAARASTGDHSGTAGTHSHFGIELPDRDTFVAWRERLREVGAQGRDEKDAVCCYARADKVWFSDPDGNAWEVWVRTGEAEQMRNSHSECCVAA